MATPVVPPLQLREQDVVDALANAAQRNMLAACIPSPLSAKAVSQTTGVPLATVYRHVKHLEEVGLLYIERSAMTPDGKPYDLYRARVSRAVLELNASGSRVMWETEPTREDRLVGMWRQLRGLA